MITPMIKRQQISIKIFLTSNTLKLSPLKNIANLPSLKIKPTEKLAGRG